MSTPTQIGPYRLLEKLGAGGMGVVHRAVREDLRREFAIKLIHAEDVADEESRRRFLREARAAAELGDHPGIVAVRDAGEHEGRAWMAMDLVEGQPLDAVLDEGDLDPRMAATLLSQAARAVHHAHTHGILHRDLKPPNILVRGLGADRGPHAAVQAIVTDFGLARWSRADADVSKLTKTGYVVGTPAYMSPELARADLVDGRSDIYALGATLYECLAGRPPFVGGSLVNIFTDLLRTPPQPPRLINPSAPEGLQRIALKCLEKDPRRRYPTAAALADDLDRWLAGERVHATHTPAWMRQTGRALRHPAVWLATGVVAVATLVTVTAWPRGSHPMPASASGGTTAQAERAQRIVLALQRLQAESGAALRVLEDAWQGAPVSDVARSAALTRVRDTVAGVQRDVPDTTLPTAWLGVAEFVAGDAATGNALLQQAVDGAGEDPLPAVLYARLVLADYANHATLPVVYWDTQGLHLEEFLEPERQRLARERALQAMQVAQDSPLWALLDVSLDARPFLAGATCLARHQFEAAATVLAAARETPPLEREVHLLLALSWYLSGRHREAAEAWHGLARQGWIEAIHKSSIAYAGSAAALAARGEDPLPTLRAATELMAGIPEGIDPRERGGLLRDRGRAWRELGEALDERGREPFDAYAAALAAFDEAAILLPTEGGIWFSRGWVHGAIADAHERRGRDPRPSWKRAIADYGKCLELDPAHARVHNNRGNAWTALANADRERGVDPRAEYEQGIADFTTAMEKGPDGPSLVANRASAWRGLALWIRDQGQDARPALDRAIDDATAALKLDPDYALALGTRGNAWWNRGAVEAEFGLDPRESYRLAVADHTRAIAARPGWAMSHLNRAAALAFLATAERTRGGDPRPHTAAALADADRVVELAPGDGGGYARRATVHIEIAQWHFYREEDPAKPCADAIREGEAALERNPSSVDALSAVCSAHQLLSYWAERHGGDPRPHIKDAIAVLTRWMQAFPRARAAWISRAGEIRRHGEADAARGVDPRPLYSQAIADLTQALEFKPTDVRALVDRAELRVMKAFIDAQQGDATAGFEAALADCNAALQEKPDEWRALGYACHALRKLGRMQEARTMLAQAEAAVPDDPKAREVLAQLRALLAKDG